MAIYRAVYGKSNLIVDNQNITIGVFSVGAKDFNTKRALYFLNRNQAQEIRQAQAMDFRAMLSYINKKSSV